MLPLEGEPIEDHHAVAIKNSSGTVGHVPFNIAPVVSSLLQRSSNKVTGKVAMVQRSLPTETLIDRQRSS